MLEGGESQQNRTIFNLLENLTQIYNEAILKTI